jgi:HEAT repeat protein
MAHETLLARQPARPPVPPPPKPAWRRGLAAGVAAAAALNASAAWVREPWPFAAIGGAVAVLALVAAVQVFLDDPSSDRWLRAASGLTALFPFVPATLLASMPAFLVFSNPSTVRAYGRTPAAGAGLPWVAVLAAAFGSAYAFASWNAPEALLLLKSWNDAPPPPLETWGYLLEASWVVPGGLAGLLALSLWSRISPGAASGAGLPVLALLAGFGIPSLSEVRRIGAEIRAAAGLHEVRDPVALVRGLARPDAYSRAQAARGLARLGKRPAIAIPPLARALGDADLRVRLPAAAALARFEPGVPGIADVLVEGLASGVGAREELIRALAWLGPRARSAGPALRPFLAEHEAAGEALAGIGVPALPELIRALADPDPRARGRAARALGRIGAPARSATSTLAAGLKDADPGVRGACTEALAAVLGEKALSQLEALLGRPGPEGQAAALALCALSEERALQALREPGPALNALREPALWENLRRTPIERDLEGTLGEVLDAVALHASMCIELDAKDAPDLSAFRRVHADARRRTALDVLTELGVDFVLDGDRIRVMTPARAREHWTPWIAATRKGKGP